MKAYLHNIDCNTTIFVTLRLQISTIISIWVWVSHKLHHSIEDLLNLVIQFDDNIKTSCFKNFFTLFEMTSKENLNLLGSLEICFWIL